MKNEITIYRHKTEKNIYLCRNWHVVGGGPETEFYYALDSFFHAVRESVVNQRRMDSFLCTLSNYLKAKMTKTMDFIFDGYSGTLKKEVEYYVKDFEPITLVEPE